ncbi:MAG: phospho-N-acetylmuramoyl-pentapeptide-transferase [Clostridiales bacterium]|nr:phospho-N-acetylmuramoyl-pentapeptide-transferase [Clostridiales bacterium]
MLSLLFSDEFRGVGLALTVAMSFAITFLGIILFKGMLPKDQGRKYAHNGSLSEGKPRGAGLILITTFTISSVLLVKLNLEVIIYLVLIFLSMLTGYLDDSSEKPWGELVKGLLDFAISAATAFAYYHFNSSNISIAMLNIDIYIHPVLFVVLGTILVWASINVTNCSDGVDGLCGTLTTISLATALIILTKLNIDRTFSTILVIMIVSIAAYLWFNASPSKILMGDAGSRALGVVLAIAFLKTGSPILFIPAAIILIIDGGLGLLKLSAIRFLKIKNFMKNIRTPIHDHLRKNKGWSDTQTVYRLSIIQFLVSVATIALVFK